MSTFDFPIGHSGNISSLFLQANLFSFREAASYVQQLPYLRISSAQQLDLVITEQRGTCSSKHALLYALAREHHHNDLRLMLGMFKMNASTSPAIAAVLEEYQLSYIPEAHVYLRTPNELIDCTKTGWTPAHFLPHLMEEQETTPSDLALNKVTIHRTFITNWLKDHPELPYNLDELWAIREACIAALSA